jgi:hypothetical protein
MRIVPLVLASIVAVALPVSGALPVQKKGVEKSSPRVDADTKELAAIVGTLHMEENSLLRDLALGSLNQQNLKQIIDLIKRSSGPTCDPGTCPEGGICVPCDPPRSPDMKSDKIRVIAIVSTLHMLENRLMRDFAIDPSAFKASAARLHALAAAIHALRGDNPCGPGSCPQGGVCVPCFPSVK